MRAARLNQVFDVEEPTVMRSSSGAMVTTWGSFQTNVWGHFGDQQIGTEQFAAGSFNSKAQYQVEMRPLPGLTDKMRLVFNGRYFDILSINDMKRLDQWILNVREGTSKGD